ncbi:MAG: ATP-binding protein, partial [Verrucomicrobia bacterium]|nr:ATP-binding protein [Verrucomicrobiota bacterium]
MALVRIGGEADKLGYHYEALWRLKLLLEVICGDAENLILEGFDHINKRGIDAELTRREGSVIITEFHSVKRQTASGKWTPGALASKGVDSVLGQVIEKITPDIENSRGLFISMSPVEKLPELADAVIRSGTFEIFISRVKSGSIKDQEFVPLFKSLKEWQGLGDDETCLRVLKALDYRCITERTLEEEVCRSIRRDIMRADGEEVDEVAVASHLCEFMRYNLGPRIGKKEVLGYLASKKPGYCEKNLSNVSLALDQVANQNDRFVREADQSLINDQRIDQGETQKILDILDRENRSWIMLTGDAGSGKSCVLAQVVDALKEKETPVFAFRFDTSAPVVSFQKLKEYIHTNWEPVGLLDSVAKRKKSVLVIDQVDALSMVAGRRNMQQWNVLYQVIKEARACPFMSIVLACRAFDLRNDAEIKGMLKSREDYEPNAVEIPMELLSVKIVENCLLAEGGSVEGWDTKELDVLRVPLHLMLFLKCMVGDASPVASLSALYNRYLTEQKRDAERAAEAWDFDAALNALVECFDENQAVAIEWIRVESKDLIAATERLISIGVLSDPGEGETRLVRFLHDTLFDHANAKLFLRGDETLADSLTKPGERQELFRRTKCRQVLTFLREGSPIERERYQKELRELLISPSVRTHIKFFVLVWLNSLNDPSEQEWEILEEVAGNVCPSDGKRRDDEKRKNHIIRLATWRSVPWFDILDKHGMWERWLMGKDGRLADDITWMLGQKEMIRARCDVIAGMLPSGSGRKSKLAKYRIAQILSWGGFHHSERLANLFIEAFEDNSEGLGNGGFWHSDLKVLAQSQHQVA